MSTRVALFALMILGALLLVFGLRSLNNESRSKLPPKVPLEHSELVPRSEAFTPEPPAQIQPSREPVKVVDSIPLLPMALDGEFIDLLSTLRQGKEVRLVLAAIANILASSEQLPLFKKYLSERKPATFPHAWGLAMLAENWDEYSLSNEYYERAEEAYLDEDMKTFWKVLRIVIEAEWRYLEPLVADAAEDPLPKVRFAAAQALSGMASPLADKLRSQLATDENPFVRAALTPMSVGQDIIANNFDFETLENMRLELIRLRSKGEAVKIHMTYDRKTETYSVLPSPDQ